MTVRLSSAQMHALSAANVPVEYLVAMTGRFLPAFTPEQVTHPTAAEEIIGLYQSGLPMEYAIAMFDGGAA